MAEEKIDVEMQDTGEFLARIHTSSGTDEIVLMFDDAEEVSDGVLGNDEATVRATVEFLLSRQPPGDLPDRIDLVDIAAAYDGAIESISKLRGYNFESTIVARTPCTYLEFPDQVFTQLMEQGDFALRFYQGTSQRTYHMYRKILSLNLFSLEENTAFYAVTHQNHMEGMTLDDISEEIGISRRTLCYIIRRWKEAGILEKAPRGYHIRDLATLEDMAHNIRQFYQSVGP